jgi:hypothetical protein
MTTAAAEDLMAANLRFEAFTANAARADRRRTTDMLVFTPARTVAEGARAVGAAVGLVAPVSGVSDSFDGRGPNGELLATPVRTQPQGNLECTAYAVASMMEIWRCRQLGTATGVPHLRIDSVFSGKADLYETADKAAIGVVDEGFTAPPPKKPKGPNAWRLKWKGFDGSVKKRPDAMCESIANNGPVAISIDIYSDFHQWVAASDDAVYTPGPNAIRRLDAHALCVVGYDRIARTWLVRNSNAAWGRGGYGRIQWGDEKLKPEYIALGVTSVIHPVP